MPVKKGFSTFLRTALLPPPKVARAGGLSAIANQAQERLAIVSLTGLRQPSVLAPGCRTFACLTDSGNAAAWLDGSSRAYLASPRPSEALALAFHALQALLLAPARTHLPQAVMWIPRRFNNAPDYSVRTARTRGQAQLFWSAPRRVRDP